MSGIKLIAIERERQLSEEGYNLEHDLEHADMSLTKTAAAYAVIASGDLPETYHPVFWP